MQILVVDHERKVANFIRQGLEEEGHAVELAADGDSALDLLQPGIAYDLVVLDILLPKCDGFSVLKATRGRGVKTPVLILSARDNTADKVTALDLGADDYLTKPFVFEEFLARVRALLRRGGPRSQPVLAVADLALDPAAHAVTRGGRSIDLTAREYSLLEYFLRNAGRVLTRVMIAEHVWGLSFDCESNIIDVYVGYLRRKIDAGSSIPLLHSVRGVGYVLKAENLPACSLRRAG
jgi:DNA-binding response OmpR family regulator